MISVSTAIDLIAYALLISGLGFAGSRFTSSSPEALLIVGIGGGCLTMLWAILSLRRVPCRRWAIGTLIVISIAASCLLVNEWMAAKASQPENRLAVVLCVLMTF